MAKSEKGNPDRKAIRENSTSLEYLIAGLCEPKICWITWRNSLCDPAEQKSLQRIIRSLVWTTPTMLSCVMRNWKVNRVYSEHIQDSGKSYLMVNTECLHPCAVWWCTGRAASSSGSLSTPRCTEPLFTSDFTNIAGKKMRKYGKIWEDSPETQKQRDAKKTCNIGHLRRNTK